MDELQKKNPELLEALAYAYVLGWYDGMNDVPNDEGKIQAAITQAKKIPREVTSPLLLEACKKVLACETCVDGSGQVYLKVPASSLFDLGSEISGIVKTAEQKI